MEKKSIIKSPIITAVLALCLYSCTSTKNVLYFQDAETVNNTKISANQDIRVQPKDKISIIVNCQGDPQITNMFNLPLVTQRLGSSSTSSITGSSQYMSGYTVDENGFIDFPVLGQVKVGGMTRLEVADVIKQNILAKQQAKDLVVTVEFMNLYYSVMGEVTKPGRYSIDRDELTIIDALSAAGDLTIYGKRENVLVIRQENGTKKSYQINLCSAQETLASPVYHLKQNDIVYVEPNDMRARQSTVNGNNVLSTSFWISVASLLTSIAVLVFK